MTEVMNFSGLLSTIPFLNEGHDKICWGCVAQIEFFQLFHMLFDSSSEEIVEVINAALKFLDFLFKVRKMLVELGIISN